jgi:hypothetical protein
MMKSSGRQLAGPADIFLTPAWLLVLLMSDPKC